MSDVGTIRNRVRSVGDRHVVKTIFNADGESGLEIYQRPDGCFSFVEIKRYDIPTIGLQWRAKVGGQRGSIYDSAESAEQEAKTVVDWLNC